MAKLYKRGNAWYITYVQKEKRIRKSLGKDEKEAKILTTEIIYKRKITLERFKKEFWSPKGMEQRAIPMHRALVHLLTDMPRVSRWVFTKPDGEKLNVHSLETRFRRLLRKLAIENASQHTWRHTFASHLMMKSGNIRPIQKLLGHKSIKTTMVYAHVSDDHLEHLINKLPEADLVTNWSRKKSIIYNELTNPSVDKSIRLSFFMLMKYIMK